MDTSVLVAAAVVLGAALIVGLLLWQRRPAPPDEDTVASTGTSTAVPARSALGTALRRALGGGLDEDSWDTIETALLSADVGVEATGKIMETLRESRPETVEQARVALADGLKAELEGKDRRLTLSGSPATIVVVGVNGTGKTTTIAKLAKRLQDEGKTVTLGAADTFRAGAGEQLQTWGDRLGVQVIRGQEGGDPASVAFDTVESARAKGADVVIIDTAGRLHGKRNLMAELEKLHRVAGGDQVSEVLLVLDATAGQNGLSQVREFSTAVPISGIVLTKLDGTARGGIVVAVERTLGVPVKFVGVGERLDDLETFDPDSFIDSLLA
ncbi:MAG: signal recognition particle-docking protein FtsY [Actinomycetota bacterium]